jgi:hypothetical protein
MMATLPLVQAMEAVETVQLGAQKSQTNKNAHKRPEKWFRSTER